MLKLDAIQHLRLTAPGGTHNRRSAVQNLTHWQAIADRITHLDLRNADGDQNAFVSFIERFTNLQQLTLGDIHLWRKETLMGHMQDPHQRQSGSRS